MPVLSYAWKSNFLPLIRSLADRLTRWGKLPTLTLIASLGTIAPVQAEGSRSLFPGTFGNRANLEWRTGQYVNLLARRTLLRVFVGPGEVLLLGSSAVGVTNPATSTQGDILVFAPGTVTGAIGQEAIAGAPAFSCLNQRTTLNNPTLGSITLRTQELAGPTPISDPATGAPGPGVPGGYVPCFYPPPTAGIYTIVITGPSGLTADTETPPTGDLAAIQTAADQDTSIAAWDVTVRSSLTSTANITGRLFTYYLALFTGANNRPLQSTIFALTTDGFIYETNLNGLDPNGFLVYGNRVGFLNSDGTPLNRNIVATDDQLLNVLGGVSIAPPEFPLFFSQPDPATISALNIQAPSIPVVTPDSFRFQGTVGANNSLLSTGGTFSYSASVPHVYELVISRDGVNFDPTNPQNRVLRGTVNAAGGVTVAWNGVDNSGNPFPIGNNYQTRLIIRSGEYHFPLLDVENSLFGSPVYRLINPPGGICPPQFIAPCVSAFYDDRGYRTANGTIVGPGVNLPLEPNPPGPDNSDFTVGFDTRTAQRSFNNLFGNTKGLDLWTFYPSAAVLTPLNIVATGQADLRLQKTVDRPAAAIGQTVVFTLVLSNDGPSPATNVVVTDRLPPGLTFVSATPSQGTFDPATGIWAVGTVPGNSTARLQITATLTASGVVRNVAEITGSAEPDPDSTPGNNNPDEDDQTTASLGVPNLRLVKRITAITRSGVPIAFTNLVDDPADANDTAAGWAQFPPVGVTSVPEPLRSGDQIEYTVYFLSDGVEPALNVNLCDQIPAAVSFVDNSNQVQFGPIPALPGGVLLSPLTPLPPGNSCRDQTNPNGTAFFSLGNISSTPGNNFGFVRFRVSVN
jgi:uncharacterized repeat protein (TIGR01451 family)